MNYIKKIIDFFNLRNFIFKILKLYAKKFNFHVCTRKEIILSLDLNETIGFYTFFSEWEPETYKFFDNYLKIDFNVLEIGLS